jgi:hypothetical protein
MKRFNLESMSIDDLWTLHESIVGVLGAKITAEKKQLEKRLQQIARLPSDRSTGVNRSGAPAQSNGQYSGQVDERVDGRGSHNEGLPPSAADKSNRTFDNPLNASDCAEASSLAPDARPGYQARVQDACQQ